MRTKAAEKTFHYPIMKYTFHGSEHGFPFGTDCFLKLSSVRPFIDSLCTPHRFVSFHLSFSKKKNVNKLYRSPI